MKFLLISVMAVMSVPLVGECVQGEARRVRADAMREAVEARAFDSPGRGQVEDERDSGEGQLPKARRVLAFRRPAFERLAEQRP